jgi:hypothetical protein
VGIANGHPRRLGKLNSELCIAPLDCAALVCASESLSDAVLVVSMLCLVYVHGQARCEAAERAAAEARTAAGVTPERCRAAVKSLADEALGWVGWSGL